jgi:sialic acid synthase SpsE
MKAGDIITEKNVKSIRPGFGLHPKFYNQILGTKVNKNFEKGERFSIDFN